MVIRSSSGGSFLYVLILTGLTMSFVAAGSAVVVSLSAQLRRSNSVAIREGAFNQVRALMFGSNECLSSLAPNQIFDPVLAAQPINDLDGGWPIRLTLNGQILQDGSTIPNLGVAVHSLRIMDAGLGVADGIGGTLYRADLVGRIAIVGPTQSEGSLRRIGSLMLTVDSTGVVSNCKGVSNQQVQNQLTGICTDLGGTFDPLAERCLTLGSNSGSGVGAPNQPISAIQGGPCACNFPYFLCPAGSINHGTFVPVDPSGPYPNLLRPNILCWHGTIYL